MIEQKRIHEAVELAVRYGQIDGGHHKMWVIDQMIRTLLGKAGYDSLIATYTLGDEYYWDEGIAP